MAAMGSKLGFGVIGDDQLADELIFSRPGPQDTGESEDWPIRRAQQVHGVHVRLKGGVAAADATLTVYLDSVAVGTVTVLTGDAIAEARFGPNASYFGSGVSVAWTTAPPAFGCTALVDVR